MEYIEANFRIGPLTDENCEILTSLLGGIGFESFVESGNGLLAYIPAIDINEKAIRTICTDWHGDHIEYELKTIADQNWNETWEKEGFSPIDIENKILIKRPTDVVESRAEHVILIDTEQAFGTGHHPTTNQLLAHLLTEKLEGLTILDNGCGTGILSILCEQLGAKHIVAIDIDQWAYRNTIKNAELNLCTRIETRQTSIENIHNQQFDLILANIGLNIITAQLPNYVELLAKGGIVLTGGYLFEDERQLISCFEALGFRHMGRIGQDATWAINKFERP